MSAYSALLSLDQTTDLNRNQDKYLFSSDANKIIRSIHEYVLFLLQFLEEFPEKANRWEGEIRDVAHKIEDIVQHFMWHQMQPSYRPSNVNLEDQLKDATLKIGLIAGQLMEERPVYIPAAVSSPARSATTDNNAVIGLDDDVIAIKERLCGQSSHLQVIPIVGMGGIGKTTLARTVYNDALILEYFQIRAWLTVSQDYSPQRFEKILLGLVEKLGREKIDESEEEEEEVYENSKKQLSAGKIDVPDMATKVYKNLMGRRYLIVIDDVWSTEVWDKVKKTFPDDNNGSRIMLTTRLSDVAAYPDSDSFLHEMQFMKESQSWDLLKQKVFTNSNCPSELEDVGKEIARSCEGLPLAVVLVAGVLTAVKETRASWEEIAENVNPVVQRGLEEILSFSYTHLPHHLRPCFLFIGGFPEDENIHASTLIKLWVAEGFVSERQNECSSKSLEDVAEGYLEDLLKRNLVLVSSRKSDEKIKSCSLHDAVRDLCVRKSHEEKFLQVLDRCVAPQGTMNERRISFSRSDINDIWGPTIRTILCFQPQSFPSWLAFLGSSTLLRVLNAIGSKEELRLPSQVFELFQLTYLALIGSFEIPPAISNLVNLQTLIIHPTFHPQRKRNWRDYENASHFSLPLEIWRMLQLRHLVLYDLHMLPHPPDGSNLPLQNLLTLSPVENLVWNEKMVQMIPNVKKLKLVYSSDEEYYHLHHLKDLLQLEKLQVTWYHGFSWQRQNFTFPCTLKKLTLVGGRFAWEDMGILGSLPYLQVLKLLDEACDGETWETADEEFPKLKYLLIDTSGIRQWITQSSHFPRLKCLVLRSCWNLMEIPVDIGEIPTLELIEVDNCGKSAVESAKKIKEEQESDGNDALQVRVVHSDEIGQLKYHVTEEIGLVAGEMMEERAAYLPPAVSSPSTTGNDAVIGLDDDLKAIKDRLCGESCHLQVIPMLGMGGIGKTTLARATYDDPLIMEHFQIRSWLTVSQDYSPLRFRKILLDSMQKHDESDLKKQLSGDKIDESEIELKVYKKLKHKRYLIVMDDVWSTEVWDDLQKIFPDDGNGSRIMLTTRLLDVAAHPSGSPIHMMRFMDESQSWDLLKQKVFTNNDCPPHLEDVGKKIARSCAGIPLAVVLVAGALSAINQTRASWDKIARNMRED